MGKLNFKKAISMILVAITAVPYYMLWMIMKELSGASAI